MTAAQEIKQKKKAENAPARTKKIAIVEGLVIGIAIVLALGFGLGVKYANHQNADKASAVTSAVRTATVKE